MQQRMKWGGGEKGRRESVVMRTELSKGVTAHLLVDSTICEKANAAAVSRCDEWRQFALEKLKEDCRKAALVQFRVRSIVSSHKGLDDKLDWVFARIHPHHFN